MEQIELDETLFFSASKNYVEVAILLMRSGAQISFVTAENEYKNAVFHAIEHGHVEMVKVLIPMYKDKESMEFQAICLQLCDILLLKDKMNNKLSESKKIKSWLEGQFESINVLAKTSKNHI